MNKKAITISIALMAITIATVTQIISTSEIEASTESFVKNDFKMADDVHTILTFKFKTGTEKIDFPVFKMTSDMVSNAGPTFEVQGIVGANSYLQKAMDSSWEMRKVNLLPFNYEYKYFDVEVDFTKDNSVIKKLKYSDCRLSNFKVDTLSDKEEGYTTEKTGFAIVDIINFECAGLTPINPLYSEMIKDYTKGTTMDYGKHHFKTGGDAHAIATFKFSDGSEKIGFPIFKTKASYLSNIQPSFEVQGTVNSYPLLHKAIEHAMANRGNSDSANRGQEYFSVDVDLQRGEKTTRTLQYSDCRISGYKVDTEFNKEEGFTNKNGFAVVDITNVICQGLTANQSLNESSNANAVTNAKKFALEHMDNSNMMAGDLHSVATFTHRDGTEKIDFQVFKQTGKVLTTANPTFELQGLVGYHPLLQRFVDESKARGPSSDGVIKGQELINVKINLERYGEILRGFEYSGCRVTDYQIDTQYDGDETYLGKTGFALLNYYSFECQGYKPLNPTYDAMDKIQNSRTTQNSLEVSNRSFDTWDESFIAKKSSGN